MGSLDNISHGAVGREGCRAGFILRGALAPLLGTKRCGAEALCRMNSALHLLLVPQSEKYPASKVQFRTTEFEECGRRRGSGFNFSNPAESPDGPGHSSKVSPPCGQAHRSVVNVDAGSRLPELGKAPSAASAVRLRRGASISSFQIWPGRKSLISAQAWKPTR